MTYDAWKADDSEMDAANIAAERRAYESEQAAELEEETAFVRGLSEYEEHEMARDLSYISFDLTERVAKARELVHTALLAAESGSALGILKIDSLLTAALAELGCKSCGKPIPVEHMQTVTYTRRTCRCATSCGGH